jgi:hypothetical protein
MSLQFDKLSNLELSFWNASADPALAVIQQDLTTELFPNSLNSIFELAIT